MSSSEDRIHAPTARRRKMARDEGMLARSRDLQLGMVLVFLGLIIHWGTDRLPAVSQIYLKSSLDELQTSGGPVSSEVQSHFASSLGYFLVELWPVWLLPIVALGAMLLQIGPFFQPRIVEPRMERILSPNSNLSPTEILYRGFTHAIKLSILSMVAWNWIGRDFEPVQAETITASWQAGGRQASSFLTVLGVGLLCWGTLEYLFQRWRLEEKLKMTAEELREEQRELGVKGGKQYSPEWRSNESGADRFVSPEPCSLDRVRA